MQKRGFTRFHARNSPTKPGILDPRVFLQEPLPDHPWGLQDEEEMAHTSSAGCRGHGVNGGRAGWGQGGCGRGANATIPRKALDVGACKKLEVHIFIIGSGNKGKVGDMLRTSMEKMATYIGTKFGDDAAQEWIIGKRIISPEPAHSQAILDRHAAQVRDTKDRIVLTLRSLRDEKLAIEAEIQVAPTDCGLLKEMREVDDQIAKGEIELADEIEMKLTEDKIAHANAWRTHRETTESLKKSRGKSSPYCLASVLKCWLTR
jgi:hypothetical protein